MSTVLLEAQARTDMGKGASRRLRRLENRVPAVIYGGDKAPMSIDFLHHKVIKALETESIYSSVFDISIDGKTEHVILKALQRHPHKPLIMHMDLQRISAKDTITKLVPIHFTNEKQSKGVKAGGIINHTMTQVEIRCLAKNLPEFIEVDMTNLNVGDVFHLSHLKLPKTLHLTADISDAEHDAPIVSIHKPKGGSADESESDVTPSDVPTVHDEDKA